MQHYNINGMFTLDAHLDKQHIFSDERKFLTPKDNTNVDQLIKPNEKEKSRFARETHF